MELGKRIREIRERKGIEQRELAEKINISQSKMNKIETGYQKRIEPEILRDVSSALGISLDNLLNEKEEDDKQLVIDKIVKEFPNADLMFHDLAGMTADDLEEVYQFIKFKSQQKK